jgi:hypothetical protein
MAQCATVSRLADIGPSVVSSYFLQALRGLSLIVSHILSQWRVSDLRPRYSRLITIAQVGGLFEQRTHAPWPVRPRPGRLRAHLFAISGGLRRA